LPFRIAGDAARPWALGLGSKSEPVPAALRRMVKASVSGPKTQLSKVYYQT
jgi:hypothetical protein